MATITDTQIEALSMDSGVAGDLEMVEVCARALAGDELARAECARVIADALAMID